MQGRLGGTRERGVVETACACCAERLVFHVDDRTVVRVDTPGAAPLVLLPYVNLRRLKAKNIIDDL